MSYRKPISKTATILSGATVSDELELRDYVLAGIITPAAFTGATITFQVSDTKGGTYVALLDSDGNTVSLGVTTSKGYGITGSEADALAPWAWVKLVSGSAEGADRSIKVMLK